MHFSSAAALALLTVSVSAVPYRHVHVKTVTQLHTVYVNGQGGPAPTKETPAVKAAFVEVDNSYAPPAPTTTEVYAEPESSTVEPAPASTDSYPSPGGGNNNPGGGPTIRFRTLDNKKRIIIFTPTMKLDNPSQPLDDMIATPGKEVEIELPKGWEGNWYTIFPGDERNPVGNLGEILCNGYAGAHYFDVSTEKNYRKDNNGVMQLFPAESKKPMSGCNTFPCKNAYVCPDDELTKATHEQVLIQTLGEGKGYDMSDDEYWAEDTRTLTTCAVRPSL